MSVSRAIQNIGVLSYEKVAAFFRSRLYLNKNLGPNTFVAKIDNRYVDPVGRHVSGVVYLVMLYTTPILAYLPDGRIVVRMGNQRTKTTQGRINSLSEVRVYQHKKEWYVGNGELFFDGYTVGDDSEGYRLFTSAVTGDKTDEAIFSDWLKDHNIER